MLAVKRSDFHARLRGFSLFEILAALAVMMILLSSALPSWRDMVRSNAVKAAAAEWMSTVQQARAESLRRGVALSVIPVQADDWSPGWMILRDVNGNGKRDQDEEPILRYGPMPAGVRVEMAFGQNQLRFEPTGRPGQAGNLQLSAGDKRRKIIVNLLGRARLCNPDEAGANC